MDFAGEKRRSTPRRTIDLNKFEEFLKKTQEKLGIKPVVKGDVATFYIKGKILCVVTAVNYNNGIQECTQIFITCGSDTTNSEYLQEHDWGRLQKIAALLQKPHVVEPRKENQSLADWLNEQNISIDDGQAYVKICESYDEPFKDINIEIRPHPEGSDRGGYVPFAIDGEDKAIWDETGWCWNEATFTPFGIIVVRTARKAEPSKG